MKECPRCFWLDKHNIWKRPRGIFPTLPNGIDLVLKRHFDTFREVCQLPPELVNKANCEDTQLYNKPELKIWRDNFKGLKYIDSNGNILVGAIDDLLQNIKTGKIIPLDFKTKGFDITKDTASFYQDQMDIYSFLLKENKLEVENFALLLVLVPKRISGTGTISFFDHLLRLNTNSDNGKALFEKAVSLLSCYCPEARCEWCMTIE